MKAITISGRGNIQYINVPEPKLRKNWVKVKVKAAGLCGSDIQKMLFDKESLSVVSARIWGHEVAGVIHSANCCINRLKKGDRVVVNPLIYTKNKDITTAKSIGRDFSGGFAEYITVPSENLKKIPPETTFEEATLIDSIAVAIHGYHLADSPKNKKILIIGDGPLALITSIVCLNQRNNVITLVKNKYNYQVARSLGINPIKKIDIRELEKKYDAVFECVGRKQDETLQIAIASIKPKGKIVVLGVFAKNFYGKIPLRELFFKEGRIIGSNSYGNFNGKDEFEMAIILLKKLKPKFSKIITHVLPLKDFKEGLRLIKNKKSSNVIKIVFKP